LITLSVFLYSLTFVGHVWLGLPVLRGWIIAFYLVAAGLILMTSLRWSALPLFLWLPYLFFPPLLTLIIGFATYGQLYQSSPVEAEPIVSIESAAPLPIIIHVSDTHFIGTSRGKTHQGADWDIAAISQLMPYIHSLRPRYLLITGDVTDTGAEPEWSQAASTLLDPAKKAGITVIMAPGTHDLQQAFRGARDKATAELAEAELSRRFLQMQTALAPDIRMVDGTTLHTLLSWKPADKEIQAATAKQYLECVRSGVLMMGERVPRSWAMGCALATRPNLVADGQG